MQLKELFKFLIDPKATAVAPKSKPRPLSLQTFYGVQRQSDVTVKTVEQVKILEITAAQPFENIQTTAEKVKIVQPCAESLAAVSEITQLPAEVAPDARLLPEAASGFRCAQSRLPLPPIAPITETVPQVDSLTRQTQLLRHKSPFANTEVIQIDKFTLSEGTEFIGLTRQKLLQGAVFMYPKSVHYSSAEWTYIRAQAQEAATGIASFKLTKDVECLRLQLQTRNAIVILYLISKPAIALKYILQPSPPPPSNTAINQQSINLKR